MATERSRDELIADLEKMRPQIEQSMLAMGMHDPDWAPLEKVLPLKWCAGFMFFGYSGRIRTYKHGFTRRCLHLDPEGNAYAYNGRTDGFTKMPLRLAIEEVFAEIEDMGFTRATPFDEEHQRKRRRAMEAAGWKIVDFGPPEA